MPDWCTSNDGPECYYSNKDKTTTDTETVCECDVSVNGKKYKESFSVHIQIDENHLIGMRNITDTDFYADFLTSYCNFRCEEMTELIKNDTYKQ